MALRAAGPFAIADRPVVHMESPVAVFDALGYWYPGTAAPALRELSLSLDPGLTLVTGGSGGGKSTFLRLLDGLVPQFHGGRIAGSARVAGRDPVETPIREMARHVGIVFQDPETQSVYGTVEREVAFGLENAGLARAAMHDRVEEALEAVAIAELRTRRLATLSGGERQRVQLAAVLALRPEVIALDEPTSQLDPQGAASVVAACLRLAASGRAVVVAEHRLESLLPAADRLVVIEGGLAAGPALPADLAGRLASPPGVVELGIALGWAPLPLDVEAARRLVPDEVSGLPSRAVAAGGAGAAGEPAWELREASVAPARGAEPVLVGVNLAGYAGEVLAVMGWNGSGKTSLLRTIAGLTEPLSGAVRRARGRAALLPQNPGALLHLPTVRAEAELTLRRAATGGGRHAGGVARSALDGEVAAALDAFGIATLADRYPRDLSAGERQRAALAAILAGSPSLALLDEPTRGMDLAARRRLVAAVRALRDRGVSVVLATHDADLAAEAADRVVVLEGGRAIDRGRPEDALGAGSPFATQIARLLPGGPVTVARAAAVMRAMTRGAGVLR